MREFPTNSEVAAAMGTEVLPPLHAALDALRIIRAGADGSALREYGGPDYPRHLSIALTNLEQTLLWLGDYIPEPEDN